jgi:hypothetical protein
MCAQVAARAELDVDLHACAPALLEREKAAILLQQKLTNAIRPHTPRPHSCSAACMPALAEPNNKLDSAPMCALAGRDWAVRWTARGSLR